MKLSLFPTILAADWAQGNHAVAVIMQLLGFKQLFLVKGGDSQLFWLPGIDSGVSLELQEC